MASKQYIISGGAHALKRLPVLAKTFGPGTRALFERVDVRPGLQCLDVGCGHGEAARLLAEMVGSRGRVVAMDLDATVLDAAADMAKQSRCDIEFQQKDVTALDAIGCFDLVYARFLLSHLADPAMVLRKMIRAARPGGLVVVEDLDCHYTLCHPRSTAYDRYVELYRETAVRRGANPYIGPLLLPMFAHAGLQDVQLHAYLPIFHTGVEKTLSRLTVEAIMPTVISTGLATAAELQSIAQALERLEADPNVLMSSYLTFQVWGRKSNS